MILKDYLQLLKHINYVNKLNETMERLRIANDPNSPTNKYLRGRANGNT